MQNFSKNLLSINLSATPTSQLQKRKFKNKILKTAVHLFLWRIRSIEPSPFRQSVALKCTSRYGRNRLILTVSVTLPLLLDKLRNKEDEDEPLGCLHLLPTAGRGNENHFYRCAPFHGQKGIRENIRHCFYVLFDFKVMRKMGLKQNKKMQINNLQ